MAKKKGFVERLLIGTEKSEDFARASLPSNRWELFWDIFKGRFGKLFKINILTFLFFIPLILLLFLRSSMIAGFNTQVPYGQAIGLGYQALGTLVGAAEGITLSANTYSLLFLPIVFVVASLGISGAVYVIRNLVWSEGIFVANDFWHGIKANAKQIIVSALFYSVAIYTSILLLSFASNLEATNKASKAVTVIMQIASYLIMVLSTVIFAHMITMITTYNVTLFQAFKNAWVFVISFPVNNAAMLLAACIPLLLLLTSGLFKVIGILLVAIFAIAFFLLVWTIYCQWIYDTYINDKIPGVKKNRGIYAKVKKGEYEEAIRKHREQMALLGPSMLGARPVKPITDEELKIEELPSMFSRKDIEKLNESKKALYEDNERYVEEHKNDPKFLAIQKLRAEDTEKQEREKRIAKAKAELKKRRK